MDENQQSHVASLFIAMPQGIGVSIRHPCANTLQASAAINADIRKNEELRRARRYGGDAVRSYTCSGNLHEPVIFCADAVDDLKDGCRTAEVFGLGDLVPI